MKEGTVNVLTDKELRAEKFEAFRGGVVLAMLAAAAAAAAYLWLYRPAPAPDSIDAPSIVRQTENQTVARIPTLHAGVRVDCTVTIDQAKNVWSITC